MLLYDLREPPINVKELGAVRRVESGLSTIPHPSKGLYHEDGIMVLTEHAFQLWMSYDEAKRLHAELEKFIQLPRSTIPHSGPSPEHGKPPAKG